MSEPQAIEQERRKAVDDLYAVFSPDVVVEAEVEAVLARIVEFDAARLSHDRGADADEAWNALAVDLRHNTGFGAGDPGALINHHRPAIEAALRSVPAPTLPMCTFPGCSCAGTLPAIPTDPS